MLNGSNPVENFFGFLNEPRCAVHSCFGVLCHFRKKWPKTSIWGKKPQFRYRLRFDENDLFFVVLKWENYYSKQFILPLRLFLAKSYENLQNTRIAMSWPIWLILKFETVFDMIWPASQSFEKEFFPGNSWLLSEIVTFWSEMRDFCQFLAKMLQNTRKA